MSRHNLRARMGYLSTPSARGSLPRVLLEAGDVVAIHIWQTLAPWRDQVGHPVRTEVTEGVTLLRWTESGAWVEIGPERVTWFLSDPFWRVLPTDGEASRQDARSVLAGVVARARPGLGSPGRRLTWDQYLAIEETTPRRVEYVDGLLYAMAGATPEHAQICARLIAICTSALAGGPCRVFDSSLGVRSVADIGDESMAPIDDHADDRGIIERHPDVTVVCGKIERDPKRSRMVMNPRVVFEVLSPSNRAKDTETNVAEYRRIVSLHHYVIVDLRSRELHIHSRDQMGWTSTVVRAGTGDLQHVGVGLDVEALFSGLDEL